MHAESSDPTAFLAVEFARRHPARSAEALEHRPASEVAEFLVELSDAQAIDLLSALRPEYVSDVLPMIDDRRRAVWIEGSDPSRLASALARLDPAQQAELLQGVAARTRQELEQVMTYPADSAGSMMDPRVSRFRQHSSAGESLQRLRELRHLRISSLHVVDDDGRFVGSVRLQDLALADPEEPVQGLIDAHSVSIGAVAPRAEVIEELERSHVPTLPVVDFEGRLIGVIRHEALFTAVETEASADIQAMVGASRTERALSPVPFAVKKRLPWLQINLLTAFLASAVVGMFEATIAQVTALAVLLPVVAGQSGNTGAQALAVTMRGLALREIRVGQAARVVVKESLVGLINGIAVAAVTAIAVYAWSRSPGLAAVIGIAMVLSMIIAGLAGATIPVILTMLGQDPAQSSSIILTTVTDVAGFFSFLGLATLLMGYL
jgi:magnesium transporter